MPTYEYACQSCGHRFDIWQEVGAAAPPCETCGQAVKKVFQAPRVIFKGSGFYVTDMRSEKDAQSKKSAETGEKSGEKSEPKSESSSATTDSKSDSKSSASESKSDSKSPTSSNSSASPKS